MVFANGAPAAGVCVYIQTTGGCLAVTESNGAWRGLINDPAGTAAPPQQNLIYQYGYNYGPQPIPTAAYVPGQSYSMGTFRLPF